MSQDFFGGVNKNLICCYLQCINNLARKIGMNRSLDLPDKTLQFIRDRPLMDEAVRPLTGGPLLLKRGPLLTRIVVDSVLALDGKTYNVMFIGTGKNNLSIKQYLLFCFLRFCGSSGLY